MSYTKMKRKSFQAVWTFPVVRLKQHMKKACRGKWGKSIADSAMVYAADVVKCLAMKALNMVGDAAAEGRKKRVTPCLLSSTMMR